MASIDGKAQRLLKGAFSTEEWNWLLEHKSFAEMSESIRSVEDFEQVAHFGSNLLEEHGFDFPNLGTNAVKRWC